jgi:hypothetical protein
MRAWLRAVRAAAAEVGERPSLWIPGALAWTVIAGWVALVVGVVRPPTSAELTFFGAGLATSGLWPWNLVAAMIAVGLVVAAAFLLAALAECVLLLGRRAGPVDVRRAVVVSLACAAPICALLLFVGAVTPFIAQAEFNAPSADGAPIMRTLTRISPLLGAALVVATAGAAVHAAALRAVATGEPARSALRRAPARLARVGSAGVAHALAIVALRIGHLVLASVLLRVLWDPIGIRLAGGGTDVATLMLLVGFVAIWLCLVLSGGALHAWGSVTWTRLLAVGEGWAAADPPHVERRPGS